VEGAPDTAAKGTGLVLSPHYLEHDPGPGHPESAARLQALLNGLEREQLLQRCTPITPYPASDAALLRCHSERYLHTVQRDIAYGNAWLSTGDTAVCEHSEAVARLAAGGVMAAVDALLAGSVRNAFAPVRPPGHHAEPSRGMGFCIYNNLAVAARHAQGEHGIRRVLIVDWDVHHGNGTTAIFRSDPSVLVFNTHQWPLYPGTGRGWPVPLSPMWAPCWRGAIASGPIRSSCRRTCRRIPHRDQTRPSRGWPDRTVRSGLPRRRAGCCPSGGCRS